MPTITIETVIDAPRELCFDLARDVDAHCATSSFTGEQAIPPGRTSGLLEPGEVVTFRGRHLGIVQTLTAAVTEYSRPERFVDVQVKGAFSSLSHLHEFEEHGHCTVMRDTITWRSPWGIFGRLADSLFVTRHMKWFVANKQQALKSLAERRAQEARGSSSAL